MPLCHHLSAAILASACSGRQGTPGYTMGILVEEHASQKGVMTLPKLCVGPGPKLVAEEVEALAKQAQAST